MELKPDPNNEVKDLLKRKYTKSVNKIKNILRWNTNKGNFMEGHTGSINNLDDYSKVNSMSTIKDDVVSKAGKKEVMDKTIQDKKIK